MAEIVVVYHSISESLYCEDGFASALCAYKKFGHSAEYVKGIHGKVIPLNVFQDKDVYFLDFCYDDYSTMTAINKVAKSLTVIDHHKTTQIIYEECPFGNWIFPERFHNEASCILSQRWFLSSNSPLPNLLRHIRDNELWLHEIPQTKPYIYKLRTLPHKFDQWLDLWDSHGNVGECPEAYSNFVQSGLSYQEQMESLAKTIAAGSFKVTVDGVEAEAVNVPRVFASIVGDILVKKSKSFGACFFVDGDTVDVELRSAIGGYDVEKLASRFGGGGHETASHFSMPVHKFFSMFEVSAEHSIDLNSMLLTLYHGIGTHWLEIEDKMRSATETEEAAFIKQFLDTIRTEYQEYSPCVSYRVLTDPVSSIHKKLGKRALYYLACYLKLPIVETVPSVWHKVFPYKVDKEVAFQDEEKILNALDQTKRDKRTEEMVVDSILASVKLSYRATLRRPTRTFIITVKTVFGEVCRLFKV